MLSLPLLLPLTETVWPTCGVSCEASLACRFQLLPLLSINVKLPAEPCRQPLMVWLPPETALPWVAPCAPAADEDGFCSGLLGLVVCVCAGVLLWSGVVDCGALCGVALWSGVLGVDCCAEGVLAEGFWSVGVLCATAKPAESSRVVMP